MHDPIDVLIVGAGAAGLTLAIDLARRRLPFRLVDRLEAPFGGSRGKGLQPRTLEVLEDLGLVDRLAAAGGPYPSQRLYRADGSVAEEQSIAAAPPTADEPYRTPLMVPQFRTEALMRERLAELGHAPAYGTALLGLAADATGVTAELGGPDGPATLRCRYLVGADGGRSTVRRALGVGFPGRSLDVRALVADLDLEGLDRDAWHRFEEGDAGHGVGLCPLAGTDLFQLQAPLPAEAEPDLSAAGLQAFLDARLPGRGLRVQGVAWASAYAMSARLAERYRVGRVLLAGDAAHIHPPTGGQGLNTSVQDAYNLGWKLAAVLAGAPDALLDSYEAERRPVAAAMLGLSTRLLAAARRGDLRRGRDVQQLDLGYAGSPLAPAAAAGRGGLAAGDRAPDGPLLGAAGQPRRLFDLFQGTHWTLLRRTGGAAPAPAPRPGLRCFALGPAGALEDPRDSLGRLYGLAPGGMALVRPDGYLGMLADDGGAAALDAYLDRVLPPAAAGR